MKKVIFIFCFFFNASFLYSSFEKTQAALWSFTTLAKMYEESIDDYQEELDRFKGRPKHYEIEVKQNKNSARSRMLHIADCLCFSDRILLMSFLNLDNKEVNRIASLSLHDQYSYLSDRAHSLYQSGKMLPLDTLYDEYDTFYRRIELKESAHGLPKTLSEYSRQELK